MSARNKPLISADDQVADIVIGHPILLESLLRMGFKTGWKNLSIKDLCSGSSMGAELCIELLTLTLKEDYRPKKLGRYDMFPLTDYYCKSVSAIKEWLKVIEHHISHLSANGVEPVLSLFCNYEQMLVQKADKIEGELPNTLTSLYEIYYSPTSAPLDERILSTATELTHKEAGKLTCGELEDLISLLLRHTTLQTNELSFCATIHQLSKLHSNIESLERIRTRMLYPLVADMTRQIKRRIKEERGKL